MLHSRDVRFNENERNRSSEDLTNDAVGHHVILEFSSVCEHEYIRIQPRVNRGIRQMQLPPSLCSEDLLKEATACP